MIAVRQYVIAGHLCLVSLLSASCGGNNNDEVEQSERRVAVKAQIVDRSDQVLVKTFTGSLEGEKQAVLYAKLAEAVEAVNVREGQTVTEGQVLLVLDKYGPSSRYSSVLSVYRNSEKNFSKMEYLFKEGAISESAYDAARTEYEVNKAAFDAVSRLVEIRSPIAGVATSVAVSEGDLVQLGQVLATVATVERLRVKFAVNEEYIGRFRIGSEVTVSSEAVGGKLVGQATSISESADPVTRSFEVEVLVDNAEGVLRVGTFVRIDVVLQALDGVLTIPRPSVVTLNNQPVVYIVRGDVARKKSISLGLDLGPSVVVDEGLAAGDTLVTLGQNFLTDGIKVNITDWTQADR
ncbi:MAG TPA: efflux RND transporter periplasmic adaptor subunit [Acidobacteriota bacterium]|nr:efflux RND transporter periplasmic adaptor subunit [Acidobacteriota bacterium]